jgi:hypothetical protein
VRGMVGDAGQDIGKPSLRIDVVHLGGLCRPPNYAEQFRSDQSFAPMSAHRAAIAPVPFGIVWPFTAPQEKQGGGRSVGSGFAYHARTA